MNSLRIKAAAILVAGAAAGFFLSLIFSPDPVLITNGLVANDEFVISLNRSIDLENPKEVFRTVFSFLDDTVIVYPSENYYYYRLDAGGKSLKGSISLFAHDRDSGIVGFDYVELIEREIHPDRTLAGGGKNLTRADGVTVTKIGDFQYSVSFGGKTVLFRLHETGTAPPEKARLRPDEVFVGRTFDESGLGFFLVFNRSISRLFWVLNEDEQVAEEFTHPSEQLAVGLRTGFAFFVDRKNGRKVLAGVYGQNVLRNNWYDGPFDQMPDNYVYTGEIEVLPFLEANFPASQGNLDRYGRYLDREGARLAVANYRVYFDLHDLDFVKEKSGGSDELKLLAEITTPVFNVPQRYMIYLYP